MDSASQPSVSAVRQLFVADDSGNTFFDAHTFGKQTAAENWNAPAIDATLSASGSRYFGADHPPATGDGPVR